MDLEALGNCGPESAHSNINMPLPMGQEVEVMTVGQTESFAANGTNVVVHQLSSQTIPTAASSLPPASAGFIQRRTASHHPPPYIQIRQQYKTESQTEMEEIVLWEPESEECEVVEVDQSELEQLFNESEQPSNNIQQVIVCDGQNLPFPNSLQNYLVEVVEPAPSPNPTPFVLEKKPSMRKKPTRRPSQEIKCLEEGCSTVLNNIIDFRKHLQEEHGFELEEEVRTFESDQEFKDWRTAYERDRRISFIYRGGTKKISPVKALTYLICHRSGFYKPNIAPESVRKRKLKPQGSCKIGTHCTAGIKLLKNLITGITEATICHTHYGHDNNENVQHLRLNSVFKNLVIDKLQQGYTFRQMLEYVHHNPDGIQGMGVVDRRAIRNIYDNWRRTNRVNVTVQEERDNSSDPIEKVEEGQSKPLLSITNSTAGENSIIAEIAADDEFESEGIVFDESTLVAASQEGDEEWTPQEKKAKKSKPRKDIKTEPEIVESVEAIESFINSDSGDVSDAKLEKNDSPRPIAKAKPAPSKDSPEDVHVTIQKLLKHGDSGPSLLFYKKAGEMATEYGGKSMLVPKDDLCIIIQTPIQRQLLQMNGKIINIDVIDGSDIDLVVISILDEFMTSVPTAWMIVDKIKLDLVEHFLRTLQRNCVEINCHYILAAKKYDGFGHLWCKVFKRLPKLILSQEDTLKEFRNLVRKHLNIPGTRGHVIGLLEEMVTTPDQQVFEETVKTLKATVDNLNFMKAMNRDWLPTRNEWALHRRLQIHTAVEEAFMKLRKFILFKATKNMKKNIHNILKIGYDRCFQRSKSLFKGDLKMQLILDEIQAKHGAAGLVERLTDNKYTVDSIFEVFDMNTACTCRIRCEHCHICVHQYWCSCGDRNLCSHAHTVRQFCIGNFVVKGEEEAIEAEVSSQPDSPPPADDVTEEDEDEIFLEEEPESEVKANIPSISGSSTPISSPVITIPKKSPQTKVRVSARLRNKGKPRYIECEEEEEHEDKEEEARTPEEEDEAPLAKRTKRQPSKMFIDATSPMSKKSDSHSTSFTPVKQENEGRKEIVREELLSLIGKLDNIHDVRVMTEVKRVSDISSVLHLGMSAQI